MNSAIFPTIPFDTVMAARSVFGRGNFYIATGDQANQLFAGIVLEDPSGRFLNQIHTLAMIYMITIFQFVETLPDQSAANAMRERIDWKYALHLDMNHPGMDAETFCEFRQWLSINKIGQQNLAELLQRLSAITFFTNKPGTSLEPDQVISDVCQISRLAKIWEAFNQATKALAAVRPDWLSAASLPHWPERYGQGYKLVNLKLDKVERYVFAQEIGADGSYLLNEIAKTNDPVLEDIAEVRALRLTWHEQFQQVGGKVWWRKRSCLGCTQNSIFLQSKMDLNNDVQQ